MHSRPVGGTPEEKATRLAEFSFSVMSNVAWINDILPFIPILVVDNSTFAHVTFDQDEFYLS